MLLDRTCKFFRINKYVSVTAVTFVAIAFGGAGCGGRNAVRNSPNGVVLSPSANAININTASPEELERIPHIGEKLAQQIVDHRKRYGPFRKIGHLLLIPGISDARFRKIQNLIRVD